MIFSCYEIIYSFEHVKQFKQEGLFRKNKFYLHYIY